MPLSDETAAHNRRQLIRRREAEAQLTRDAALARWAAANSGEWQPRWEWPAERDMLWRRLRGWYGTMRRETGR